MRVRSPPVCAEVARDGGKKSYRAQRGMHSPGGAMMELVAAYTTLNHVRDQIVKTVFQPVQTELEVERASNVDHLSDVLFDLIAVAGTIAVTSLRELQAKSELLFDQLSGGCTDNIDQLMISICLDIQNLSERAHSSAGDTRPPLTDSVGTTQPDRGDGGHLSC
jgi:hypothetical protein